MIEQLEAGRKVTVELTLFVPAQNLAGTVTMGFTLNDAELQDPHTLNRQNPTVSFSGVKVSVA
jgi:hypothetical protein